MRKTGEGYRIIGDLINTNRIMKKTFWSGDYSGLTEAKIQLIINTIKRHAGI